MPLLETIVLTANALSNGTYGVNAKLPDVPRFAGHAEPPAIVDVKDIARDPGLLDDELGGDNWPVLVVDLAAEAEAAGDTISSNAPREVTVPVLIVLLTGKSDADVAVRDVTYTLRAILRTLWHLMNQAPAADRSQNDVELCAIERITFDEVDQDVSGARIRGVIMVEWKVRDLKPGG